MYRPLVALRAALVLCAALMASSVAPASAASYHAFLCETPSGNNAPISGLSFSNSGDYVGWGENCGAPGGHVNLQLGSLGRTAGNHVSATLYAPASIKFTGLWTRRRMQMAASPAGDYSATPVWVTYRDGVYFDGDHVIEACAWYQNCTSLDWPSTGTSGGSIAPASSIIWSAACGGSPGGSCGGTNGPNRILAQIFGIHLQLDDSMAPGGTADGPALQGDVVHKGTVGVRVEGYDWSGSGVAEAYATIGGTVVGSARPGGTCTDSGAIAGVPDYERIQPCPMTATLDVPVNTAAVPDGTRTIQIWVKDGAGNATRVIERQVRIDNVPPPAVVSAPAVSVKLPNDIRPGDTATALAGNWSGAGLKFAFQWQRTTEGGWADVTNGAAATYLVVPDDVGHRLRVVVRATNDEGTTEAASPATAEVRSGATVRPQSLAPTTGSPSAAGAGGAPQLVVDREQRSVQVAYGAKIVVTGRLVDADARPIADAEVDVFEQVSTVGAPWRKVSTIRTDSQGGYAFRPATTGSRVLRFAYSALRNEGEYRATREVVIAVTAGMRLRAVQRTVARRGVIRLRGRVFVEPLPASGTWVEVQVLDAGTWRTVATRRTSSSGRWTWKHRMRTVGGARFVFRARLRPVSDVPSAEAKSAALKVRVR